MMCKMCTRPIPTQNSLKISKIKQKPVKVPHIFPPQSATTLYQVYAERSTNSVKSLTGAIRMVPFLCPCLSLDENSYDIYVHGGRHLLVQSIISALISSVDALSE